MQLFIIVKFIGATGRKAGDFVLVLLSQKWQNRVTKNRCKTIYRPIITKPCITPELKLCFQADQF